MWMISSRVATHCLRQGSLVARPSVLKTIAQLRLTNADDARMLVAHLKTSERDLLDDALRDHRVAQTASTSSPQGGSLSTQLTASQIRQLLFVSAVPFIAFGMLDNVIMICAGEYIDKSLGAALAISTMAAAALGNIISDVAGVGLASTVEAGVARLGVRPPRLTVEQVESTRARFIVYIGRAMGLAIGCLIGMFPLFFFDHHSAT